jgi:hypothetical protein
VKRVLLITVVLLVALPACGDRFRPEGMVERWLLALNQGAAGQPERYADGSVSDEVLPDWDTRDPGALDVIEVGSATYLEDAPPRGHIGAVVVPFRLVSVDGSETRGRAIMPQGPTAPIPPIASVDSRAIPRGVFPSEGGPPVHEASPKTWLWAVLTGMAIAIVGWVLMRLAR